MFSWHTSSMVFQVRDRSVADIPELLAQWHPTRNVGVDPRRVGAGSAVLAWWKCPAGPDHEWQATANHRTGGGKLTGCGFCQGLRPSVTNSIASLAPEVAGLYHPANPEGPDGITRGSSKTRRWLCHEGHEWEEIVNEQVQKGVSCPACHSIAVLYPGLVEEFHPTANGDLRVDRIKPRSDKKVVWRCLDDPSHSPWKARPADRTGKGSGCPSCAGKALTRERSLSSRFPEVAATLHPDRNHGVTGWDLFPFGRDPVWWVCEVGHTYESSPSDRVGAYRRTPPGDERDTGGSGCPVCRGREVAEDGSNSLATVHPEIAAHWHRERNGDRTPADVTVGTNSVVWWRCLIGSDHEWEQAVSVLVSNFLKRPRGSEAIGCPFCRGLRVSDTNSLAMLYPKVVTEWHPDLNGDLNAEDFTYGSGIKVWWQCPRVAEHVWRAKIVDRTVKTSGCPDCTPFPRSRQEVRLAHEIDLFFSVDLDTHTVERGISAVDIVIPEHRIVVEFDGAFWHKDKETEDRAKTDALVAADWSVIRVRQAPLAPISQHDVVVPPEPLDLKTCADIVLQRIVEVTGTEPDGLTDYLAQNELLNTKAAMAYWDSILHPDGS